MGESQADRGPWLICYQKYLVKARIAVHVYAVSNMICSGLGTLMM